MNSLSIRSEENLFSLEGALKSTNAIKVKPQLLEYINKKQDTVSVDISSVNTVDITGLNSLLMAKKHANNQNKSLTITANSNNPIFELVHLTKFGKFLNIEIV